MESGKRIRPLILVLAAESIGKADDNAYVASCAVEFLHTIFSASLSNDIHSATPGI